MPDIEPDLIISSGGKSAFASYIFKRLYRRPNIFVGVPEPFPDTWFDLIISPVARKFSTSSLISGIIPNTVTTAKIDDAGASYWGAEGPNERYWTLMIGGPSKSHKYRDEDWAGLIAGVNYLARTQGVKWLISTSRRTPEAVEAMLAEQVDAAAVKELVLFNRMAKKVLLPFLYASERVFVTQDSLTMASEALNSGKPVTLLAPESVDVKEGSFFAELVNSFPKMSNVSRQMMVELVTFTAKQPDTLKQRAFVSPMSDQLLPVIESLVTQD